jgi:hypothetical protein
MLHDLTLFFPLSPIQRPPDRPRQDSGGDAETGGWIAHHTDVMGIFHISVSKPPTRAHPKAMARAAVPITRRGTYRPGGN